MNNQLEDWSNLEMSKSSTEQLEELRKSILNGSYQFGSGTFEQHRLGKMHINCIVKGHCAETPIRFSPDYATNQSWRDGELTQWYDDDPRLQKLEIQAMR